MKVLVTGSKGFIGKNLCLYLKNIGHIVFEHDLGSTDDEFVEYIKQCDFIIHLAGINRPLTPEEFIDGNVNFTKKLLDLVSLNNSKAPVIFSSSIQAALDNLMESPRKLRRINYSGLLKKDIRSMSTGCITLLASGVVLTTTV